MTFKQSERVVGTVPHGIGPRQHELLDGDAETARRCEQRGIVLRRELQSAFDDAHPHVAGPDDAAAIAAVRIALELDAPARVQPRIDTWLNAYVAGLVGARKARGSYGDAAPV